MSEVVGAALGLLESIVPPLGRRWTYAWNSLIPNALPDPNAMVELFLREYIDKGKFDGGMAQYGLNQEMRDLVFKLTKQLNSPDDLLINYWRYKNDPKPTQYDETDFKLDMKHLGFTDKELNRFVNARLFYPSPQDFIQFATRDVYIPDYVTKYGMDTEFPEDITPYLAKIGFSNEWIHKFWQAHWGLPSVQDAQQFKWWDVITDDDLNRLLRAQGWEPYWRDKFKAIMFNPYTRVDARRMYALGVLDDKGYVENYKRLGYDDEHANGLLQYAKAENQTTNKDLTKTAILDLYKEGKIKRADAVTQIHSLGYTQDDADNIVSLVDYQIQTEQEKNEISTIHDSMLAGLISFSDASASLDKLNLESTYRDKLLAQWNREIDSKRKLPTKAELVKMYQYNIIDKDGLAMYLDKLGYAADIITLYQNLLSQTGSL